MCLDPSMDRNMDLVDALDDVWRSTAGVCEGLSEQEWERPTECPGWTVKDIVSHLIGTELGLMGDPLPDHEVASFPHIKNMLGGVNEIAVDYRRGRSSDEVLREFLDVTERRIKQLRSWGPEDFDRETWMPTGQARAADFLELRIFDSWVHEQDIRTAVGKPGGLSSPAGRYAFDRMVRVMPKLVAKDAGAPDGAVVALDVSGPVGGTINVVVEGGRARLEPGASPATATLSMDLSTFTRLSCGRWTADAALADGALDLAGDEALALQVARHLAFTP